MRNSRRHILLVEEHREICSAFGAFFAELHGYVLHVAPSVRDALALVQRQDVDLAVVDLTPAADATARLDMLLTWRSEGLTLPVIATSARDFDGFSVKALNAGADDFLRKPYLFSEMLARIERQLARGRGPTRKQPRIDGIAIPAEPFTFAGATIQPDMRIVFPNGRVSKLTAKQLGILKEFELNSGALLLKERLIHAVWGQDANTNSSSVHQFVHLLRKLYREGGIDLNVFVEPENKAGWRIASHTPVA